MAVPRGVLSLGLYLLAFAAATSAVGQDEQFVQERQGNLPSEVTLQVYVICDGGFTLKFDTNYNLVRYVVTFFNAVNLVFKALADPKVQLEVVMIQETRTGFAGKWQHEVFEPLTGDVDALSTLKKLANYTSHLPQYRSSDIIFLMTTRQVYYVNPETGQHERVYNPAGWSYRGSVCKDTKVAIGKDDGVFFSGVRNAARQIARVLGASLDQVEVGAESCKWKDGYLMGHFGNGYNRSLLSKCSKDLIKKTLGEAAGDCLARKYKKSYSYVTSDLPGNVVDEEKFCHSFFPESTRRICNTYSHLLQGKNDPKRCSIICCKWDSWVSFQYMGHIAFDGRKCGENKICILGKCEDKSKYMG